jgi:hypothetical protein
MLQINLNSKNTNEAPTELPLPYRLLWRMGFDAFCEGRSYFDMPTTPESQGWRDALAACADCETASYLGKVN